MYGVLGCVCLLLAVIGFLIPVLPGFLFLIFAVVCFSAVSSRFARFLERHPAATAWRRRWHRGTHLPLRQRIKLMLWLTADSAMGRKHRQI
tara:strand:- start:3067 stop:3339 length:273 start_codon:yes stop_codon:yes gene_type:complete